MVYNLAGDLVVPYLDYLVFIMYMWFILRALLVFHCAFISSPTFFIENLLSELSASFDKGFVCRTGGKGDPSSI
jgi:hypothetical protein